MFSHRLLKYEENIPEVAQFLHISFQNPVNVILCTTFFNHPCNNVALYLYLHINIEQLLGPGHQSVLRSRMEVFSVVICSKIQEPLNVVLTQTSVSLVTRPVQTRTQSRGRPRLYLQQRFCSSCNKRRTFS